MDNECLRRLIVAAGGGVADAEIAVKEIGSEAVVPVLLRELVERADFGGVDTTAAVLFELDDQSWTITADGFTHGRADCEVTVRQELWDLLRGVFGPAAARTNCTRSIRWPDSPALGRDSAARFGQVSHFLHRLLAGSTAAPVDLTELILRFGSDKWGFHHYTGHYSRFFEPLRDLPLTVLELGIGGYGSPTSGGGSLKAWQRYFHRGLVFGVDIVDKSPLDGQRRTTRRGDQSDKAFLDGLIAETGAPDIIIDDGSHRCDHVIASFQHLFPRLAPGGIYVVEDTQTSYWESFGGSASRLSDVDTSMGYFKSLLDGLNHSEFHPDDFAATGFERQIAGISFFHNLVFVQKAVNDEGSLPGFVAGKPVA